MTDRFKPSSFDDLNEFLEAYNFKQDDITPPKERPRGHYGKTIVVGATLSLLIQSPPKVNFSYINIPNHASLVEFTKPVDSLKSISEDAILANKMNEIHLETQSILRECNYANWDGYGGGPISKESCMYAINFLSLLPDRFPKPDLVPEPSGLLGMEWEKEDSKISLMLSFNKNKRASFGFINRSTNEEYFGSWPYNENIPEKFIPFLNYFI